VRLITNILVTADQQIAQLGETRPCPHCRDKKRFALANHVNLWTVPNALVLFVAGDETVVCLDCLDEKRKNV